MDTNNIVVWIIVAVVAVVIVALAIWALLHRRTQHRRGEAADIRDKARDASFQVGQREALAEETAAKARVAAAEADVKSAEAERLQQRAGARSSDAATSREELNTEWERADAIDPDYNSPEVESAEQPRGSETPVDLKRGGPPPTRGLNSDKRL